MNIHVLSLCTYVADHQSRWISSMASFIPTHMLPSFLGSIPMLQLKLVQRLLFLSLIRVKETSNKNCILYTDGVWILNLQLTTQAPNNDVSSFCTGSACSLRPLERNDKTVRLGVTFRGWYPFFTVRWRVMAHRYPPNRNNHITTNNHGNSLPI